MNLVKRIFLKNKSYSLINMIGLAFGIASALIFFLMIDYLTGIDAYHQKKDRIYRIVTQSLKNEHEDFSSGVPVPLINALENDFSEIEIVAPVYNIRFGKIIIDKSEKIFEEEDGIAYCDDRLYQVLDRKWVRGNKEASLNGPNKVVLSESWALKFFGSLDIIGESILVEGIGEMVIAGVMEDYPKGRTDFPFEMLISYATIAREMEEQEGWSSNRSDFQCYILLEKDEDIRKLEQRLPAFADKYYGEDRTDARTHHFQPLSDLHFNENYSNFRYKSMSRSNILIMILLGVFLVAIACINFINLSTAQAAVRFKEVGIRKVLGSSRVSIIISFLQETAVITLVAILIALGLAELSLFKINQLLDLNLSIDILRNSGLWVFMIAGFVMVTVGAGLYPGIVISRFQPSSALKGGRAHSRGTWRKGLVIFQFMISQILIIGTLIILNQLNFYKSAKLGFDKENIINVSLPANNTSRMDAFSGLLHENPWVRDISFAGGPPAWGSSSTTNVYYNLKGLREELFAQVKRCDDNYTQVYGLKLIAGNGLIKSDSMDRAIVNESFIRTMGLTNPVEGVGITISLWGTEIPISGVVEDFHTLSFKRKIEPVVLYTETSQYQIAGIKLSEENISEAIQGIEQAYSQVYGGYSFNYSFMDETFARFYRGEEKMAQMLMTFSGIAIFIGCIGLYGLVSFMATQRTKEIGVRKVLGASIFSVVYIFSREFIILILLAFLGAAPLVYFGMESWLSQFAYRINPGITTFLTGAAVTFFVAMATIAYKSVKASLSNPADALKEE